MNGHCKMLKKRRRLSFQIEIKGKLLKLEQSSSQRFNQPFSLSMLLAYFTLSGSVHHRSRSLFSNLGSHHASIIFRYYNKNITIINLTMFSHGFLMANQGKLLRKLALRKLTLANRNLWQKIV